MEVEPFVKTSFYIVAHADDWQLFMQPNAYRDIVSPHTKVIFIIMTAGDAGRSDGFWQAREEGTKSSIRFCLAPHDKISEKAGTRNFNGHAIPFWSANNTTSYFFRLPDGNLDGNGFSSNCFESLSRFREGEVSAINAIDNSGGYKHWLELQETVETTIKTESRESAEIIMNYLNPDIAANPQDHKDHTATGQLIEEMRITSGFPRLLYLGYSVKPVQAELNVSDVFWKTGMFSAYEKSVFDNAGYSTLKESVETYLNWCLSPAQFISVNI